MTTPALTVTILGCGDIGQRLAAQLPADIAVVGLRRSPCTSQRIQYRQADVADADSLRRHLPLQCEVIIITMTPSDYSDAGYQQAYVHTVDNLLTVLAEREAQPAWRAPQLILFVSSTSVYGQSNGEWVDESSATEPEGYSGQRLLEAEQRLQQSRYPATSVRFSGIYGPGRHRLIQQVRDGKGSPEPAADELPLYSNRIHVDDCAGVLAHLLQQPTVQPLYLASDCEPSPLAEVKQWLATQMGYPTEHLQPGPEAANRASKRCRNQRLLESGYRFRYPTYQQGYRQVLDMLDGHNTQTHNPPADNPLTRPKHHA